MKYHFLPSGCGRLLLSPREASSSGGGFSFADEPITYFDPTKPVSYSHHQYPHMQQGAVPCFVTWRMGDSLSQVVLRRWKAEQRKWQREHPRPWSRETEYDFVCRYERGINQRLRQGIGSCPLRNPGIARIVADALHYFDGDRYELIAFVVMPNHVHVLFRPHPEHSLSKIVQSWKGCTARAINRRLNRRGRLWYRAYFDHLIRDDRHLRNCIRYIRRNPRNARLPAGEYLHWESPTVQLIDN